MKTTTKAAVLLLTTLFISTSQVVLADDSTHAIEAVRVALNIVDYPDCLGLPGLAKHKNFVRTCGGLNKKLNDADAKIGQRRDADAKRKLCDFGTTLFKLADRAKPIISWENYYGVYYPLMDAQALVDPAQDCV
jgi:hypothetical protein